MTGKLVGTSLLRRYFYSGWAFFMPYLFFYLLYYWQKWPVNPPPGHTLGSSGHIPALLQVYWILHVIHAALGLLALCTWWHEPRPSSSAFRFPLSALLPWLLLALLFSLPGVYLEWPSDPWEHLRRIFEWSADATVGAHSAWPKSSYFFTYTLVGGIPAIHQLAWLNVYYTAICLLLCWQYYRLALASGLSERASLIFVILQTILFGNNVFSFYRYYGLSSSIYAQLCAVALTRLGIEFAQQRPARRAHGLKTLGCAALLVLLTAFNHLQGLGIALLGLAAVAIWRVLKWKASALWLLTATAAILSIATLHWWPHHRGLDRICRAQGWFTGWDGFNLLSPRSPAGDRALQIQGLPGVVNLIAGLLLLYRNRLVGWLTIAPILALSLPFVAIPLAGALLQHGGISEIVTFHRMLFAIPPGLALVCLGEEFLCRKTGSAGIPGSLHSIFQPMLLGLTVLVLLAFTTVPARGPFFNRAWHVFVKPPDDLTMKMPWGDFDRSRRSPAFGRDTIFAATSGLSFVMDARQATRTLFSDYYSHVYMRDGRSPIMDFSAIRNALIEYTPNCHVVVAMPQPTIIYTPYSFAAICSTHWLPQEAALNFSGTKELITLCTGFGLKPAGLNGRIDYYESGK